MPRTDQLTPFDSERARAAGKRSAEVRAAQRLAKVDTASSARQALETLADTYQRQDLGRYAIACAGWIMGQIVTGRIRVPGGDAAALLRACVDIARLEAGEATSHALHAHLSAGDVRARVAELQQQARELLDTGPSATALAAADGPADSFGVVPARVAISAELTEGEGFA